MRSNAFLTQISRINVKHRLRHLRIYGSSTAAAYLFVAPAIILLIILWGLPLLWALILSFTDYNIYTLADVELVNFVGINNYVRLWSHPLFWKAVGNTFYFVFAGGSLSVCISLGAALLIHSKHIRFKRFFSTVFFAPVATTLVAVAVVWRFIYHPRHGWLNHLLSVFGIDAIDWLGDPVWAMPALILMSVWKNFGFNMVIFIAGLQQIPDDLYAASRIDGASYWQQFRHVTLPMLSPTFLFVGIITVIGYFQLFAEPYVMTQGGPLQSTVSIVYLMYEEGFRWWNMGYASAIAFALFFIFLAGTSLYMRLRTWRA